MAVEIVSTLIERIVSTLREDWSTHREESSL